MGMAAFIGGSHSFVAYDTRLEFLRRDFVRDR